MSKVRMGPAFAAAIAASFVIGAATPASAHAFGQRYDLPLPLAYYLAASGAAVALSFVVIGLFFRDTSWLSAYPRLNLLNFRPVRAAAHDHFLLLLKLAAVLVFLLILATGFFGAQEPLRNLAPTMVWVVWWVGFVVLSAFVGDLWMLVNPWRSLFGWAEALYPRLFGGRMLSRGMAYPEWLGVWPAVALLLCFGWLELVFPEPALPRNIAWLAVAYSLLTWTGMFLFGRETWLRHGEAFSAMFSLFARFAPMEIRTSRARECRKCGLGCRDLDGRCINCTTCFALASRRERELALRPYAVGLTRNEPTSGSMVAFVVLVLSIVIADGVMATPGWRSVEALLVARLGLAPEPAHLVAKTLGLVGVWLTFLAAYLAISNLMAVAAGGRLSPGTVMKRFVFTLVPIAVAYHLAHYLSFLLIQGQYAIPLMSDPFGYGWDLFGTAGYRVDIAVVGARFAWLLAVIAIVVGHIVAVFLAHALALKMLAERRAALRSELPITALMVAFTVISLSILAEPIVQRAPAVAARTMAPPQAVPVPADAILPEAGSGRFRPVGPEKVAKVALTYGALTSAFHDGTRTTAADILYPFAVAYRWGAKGGAGKGPHDPAIARATALIRERLAGLKLAGVDMGSKSFRVGDMTFTREMVLVTVYLKAAPGELAEAAAVAPPWSSVPWHVIALMEEAVARGWAAFSISEAERRGVPWLDVARDEALKARLAALVEEFARTGFVPEPLAGMVDATQARKRWQALKAFHGERGHFLVTNGPYSLKSWGPEATVLGVFRDKSYPLGVGSYDAYAIPRRATIAGVEMREGGLRVSAKVEKIEKFARSYKILDVPLTGPSALGKDTLECRFLVIGTDGAVVRAGSAPLEKDGTFDIDLGKASLAPGDYTILVTLILNGNRVDPDIRSMRFQVR